jgi:hypothetical protein
MLRRFASSDQRQVGERAAKACLLAPQPVGDIKTLTALADRAVAPGANPSLLPWFRMCKGMAEYRAGHYESAIDWLARARTLEAATGLATLDLFTAMAHHRLGHAAEARQWLEQAVARMDTRVPRPGTDDLDSPENYLICAIVRREAEALIGRPDHPPVGGSEKR